MSSCPVVIRCYCRSPLGTNPQIRTIPHLELIRIGTRVPGSLPERITPKLCEIIKKYHPFYMNLHFNHPDELTPEVKRACVRHAGGRRGSPGSTDCVTEGG